MPNPDGPGPRRDGSDLFARPHSLRWPTERRAFWLTLLFAPTMAGIIGVVVREEFSAQQIAFLIVLAMVYVTLARGRLLGTSIRAHDNQLPELHRVVERCARLLRVPMPHVFVREDLFVCITGMGLGQPYALALSSQWLPHLDDDELTFLVGAELAHVAAGHTRISSMFSASGRENPFVALIFGAWLRRTEYTADRVGLLCCGSLDAAIRAIFKCSFHPIASRVSFVAFADQRRELDTDPGLRMGEWLGESPYAVNRLRELQRFHESPLHAYWATEFARRGELLAEPAQAAEEPVKSSAPRDAGIFQRGLAFLVDFILVSTIAINRNLVNVDVGGVPATKATSIYTWVQTHFQYVQVPLEDLGSIFLVLIYSAVLVALAGRTFGMMIFGLRVVRRDLGRVSAVRAVWRYFLAFLSTLFVVPLFLGLFTGRLLHDRLSGTRVVRGGAG